MKDAVVKRKQGPRAKAFESTDLLLCLLENLGIKSARMEVCTEEMLDEYIARTEHLWSRDEDGEEQ